MPSKRVQVQYRRYYRGSEPAITEPLSNAIWKALAHSKDGIILNDDVSLRSYQNPDSGTVILNGRLVTQSGDVYGELVRFDPDARISLLVQNSSSPAELDIRQPEKPSGSEILRGISFFLARGDHVLVIEDGLLNSIFERYLRWFLGQQAPIASRDARIHLIPKLQGKPDILKNVKSITLQPRPSATDELSIPLPGSEQVVTGSGSDILEILSSAHFDSAEIERLAQVNNAQIELTLRVSLKAGSRRLKLSGEEVEDILRNVPEEDLIIVGEGARNNRGTLEHVNLTYHVEHQGGLLIRSNAWNALQEAAAQHRDNGLIE